MPRGLLSFWIFVGVGVLLSGLWENVASASEAEGSLKSGIVETQKVSAANGRLGEKEVKQLELTVEPFTSHPLQNSGATCLAGMPVVFNVRIIDRAGYGSLKKVEPYKFSTTWPEDLSFVIVDQAGSAVSNLVPRFTNYLFSDEAGMPRDYPEGWWIIDASATKEAKGEYKFSAFWKGVPASSFWLSFRDPVGTKDRGKVLLAQAWACILLNEWEKAIPLVEEVKNTNGPDFEDGCRSLLRLRSEAYIGAKKFKEALEATSEWYEKGKKKYPDNQLIGLLPSKIEYLQKRVQETEGH